ncbi:MAG: hypothetical protein KDB53_06990 [Planctomycetes bacterium]|nr:hypothetical protein [Planctomycetota bacterium]
MKLDGKRIGIVLAALALVVGFLWWWLPYDRCQQVLQVADRVQAAARNLPAEETGPLLAQLEVIRDLGRRHEISLTGLEALLGRSRAILADDLLTPLESRHFRELLQDLSSWDEIEHVKKYMGFR